jgi:hypothetical protein
MDREKMIEKLRVEFEALNDTQKDYLVGIAKALSFASASEKAATAPSPPTALSPPGPDERKTKREGQRH